MSTVVLTHELIESGKSNVGGWTRKQIEALGVTWPPKAGWKAALVGTEMAKEDFDAFVALKNTSKAMKGRLLTTDAEVVAKLRRPSAGEQTFFELDGRKYFVRRTD